MRENYRPDLSFHANDGVHAGGSDGLLRMPPMEFEPIINMADAVRQPRPFRAETAAWLGVITADMPMQNWYVYNHISYARWVLEDATSALNAKILSLTPSLLGPVTTVQPTVSFIEHGGGGGGDGGSSQFVTNMSPTANSINQYSISRPYFWAS